MRLDELITWSTSQADTLDLEADVYETGPSYIKPEMIKQTVNQLRGRAAIHRDIAAHLTTFSEMI